MREATLERNQMIYDRYLVEEKTERKQDDIIRFLSTNFKIGEFYVRNILKQYGVEINRKENYDRKDKEDMLTRNNGIVSTYNEGKNPDEIAATFNISAARVRQILKAAIGKDFKKTKIAVTLAEIKSDVEAGKSHTDILEKYGKEMLRKVKVNFEYDTFKETRKVRDGEIIRRYKSGEIEQIYVDADIIKRYNKLDDTGKKNARNAGRYPMLYEIIKTFSSVRDAANNLVLKRSALDEISHKEAGHNIMGGFEWRAVCTPQNIADSMRLTRDYVYFIVNFERRLKRNGK